MPQFLKNSYSYTISIILCVIGFGLSFAAGNTSSTKGFLTNGSLAVIFILLGIIGVSMCCIAANIGKPTSIDSLKTGEKFCVEYVNNGAKLIFTLRCVDTHDFILVNSLQFDETFEVGAYVEVTDDGTNMSKKLQEVPRDHLHA